MKIQRQKNKMRHKTPPELRKGLSWCVSAKESACQCRRCRGHKFNPWVRKTRFLVLLVLQYSC